jgi:cobalt-zinc-cadmium efflux system protein
MSHGHTHGIGHHTHRSGDDSAALITTLCLILAFLVFELALAIVSRSLALMADAAHMLVDALALASAVWANRLARQPPAGSWTFGLKRAEILSAQANGITLLALGAVIGFVAIQRLTNPIHVHGGIVLIVAIVGIAVNLIAAGLLRGSARESMNVEGSFQHIVTDLFAFIATLVAGVVILATGFNRADAIASLLVVALMFRASYSLLRETGRILLEGGPAQLDVTALAQDLASHDHVVEIHDVHVWTITSGFPALAAHVLVEQDTDCHEIRRSLEELLHTRYAISHTTLQVDHAASGIISPESLTEESFRHSNTRTPSSWRSVARSR